MHCPTNNRIMFTAGRNGFGRPVIQANAETFRGLAQQQPDAVRKYVAPVLRDLFGIYFAPEVPTRYAHVIACDIERFKQFFHAMLKRGIYLAPSAYEAGFVSITHDNAVVDATIAAAEESFAELR